MAYVWYFRRRTTFYFELIEYRHDETLTILCTQNKQEDWTDRVEDEVHADTIFAETFSMNMREYCARL